MIPAKHAIESPADGGTVRRPNGTIVHVFYCNVCGERARPGRGKSWAHLGSRGPRGFYSKGTRQSDLRWPYGASDDPLVEVVNQAIPKNLPEQIREEACQELALALLEGRAKPEAMADDSKEAVAAARHGYQFSAKWEVSMDIPAPGATSETPLRDLLAASHIHGLSYVAEEDVA